MNPQIVSYDYGRHNSMIELSGSRIMEGATWKKQRVIVLVPAGASIPSKVYLAHMNLIFPPNQPVFRMLCVGMEVGEAYSMAIEQILAHPDLCQWEYLLTVEHDNVPPPDGVLRLIQQMDQHPEFACIGGLYWTKGEMGCPQLWGDPKDPILNYRPQVPRMNELQEVCGTGMGFNLFRISVFKDARLRRPFFKTQAEAGGVCTQDLYFWSDARKFGYRCAVDNAVLVGHYEPETDITW